MWRLRSTASRSCRFRRRSVVQELKYARVIVLALDAWETVRVFWGFGSQTPIPWPANMTALFPDQL